MSIFANPIQGVKIIAEFGVNHNNNFKLALKAVKEVAKAGADCIKFQSYRADTLVTKTAPKFWNWKGDADKTTQHDAYSAIQCNFNYKSPCYHTRFKDTKPYCRKRNAGCNGKGKHSMKCLASVNKTDECGSYEELMNECKKYKIEFLSTPFDEESLMNLMNIDGVMGMKAIKVSSSDLTNIPFLIKIGFYKVPVLLSTGASTMDEIKEALEAIGHKEVVLLHCTLCYPTKDIDSNLNLISTLKANFPDYEVGLSDHTIGILAPSLAVSMGAKVIEKHFTLNKKMDKSADHWLSVNPKELKELVKNVRKAESMMGSSEKRIFDCEQETYKYDKRSIVANCDISAGEYLGDVKLICKRPGTGIKPKFIKDFANKKAKVFIPQDTIIQLDMME